MPVSAEHLYGNERYAPISIQVPARSVVWLGGARYASPRGANAHRIGSILDEPFPSPA